MNKRGITSVILSILSYNVVFVTLSCFITFVGIVNAVTCYQIYKKLTSDDEFVNVLNAYPSLELLFKSYQNTTLLFIAMGILTYFVSRSVAKHLDGEQTALIWQIDEIKNGSFEARRNLRKNDRFHDVMEALHDLGDNLSTKK